MKVSELKNLIKEAVEEELQEDWDNYSSIEEIKQKYFQKMLKVLNINLEDSNFSSRIFELEKIMKIALDDAYTLGSVDAIKNSID